MDFTYKMSIKIEPAQIRRGKSNEATVTITESNGEVAYCMASIKGYNLKQKLKHVGNNVYKFSGKIPIFAPRGNYEILVWGYNNEMGEGPRKKIKITLK